MGNIVRVEMYGEIINMCGDMVEANLYTQDGEKIVRIMLKPEDIKGICQKTPDLKRWQKI